MLSLQALTLLKKLTTLLHEGKYLVLDELEILEGTDLNKEMLPPLFEELKTGGDVVIKFHAAGEWCLMTTPSAKITLERAAAPAVSPTASGELEGGLPNSPLLVGGRATSVEGGLERGEGGVIPPKKRFFLKTFFVSVGGSLVGTGIVGTVFYLINMFL